MEKAVTPTALERLWPTHSFWKLGNQLKKKGHFYTPRISLSILQNIFKKVKLKTLDLWGGKKKKVCAGFNIFSDYFSNPYFLFSFTIHFSGIIFLLKEFCEKTQKSYLYHTKVQKKMFLPRI